MKVVAKKFAEGVDARVRRAAIVADQVAITQTPVDTGRARGNWRVGIGGRPTGYSDEDRDASAAMAQGSSAINTWKSGEGSIYITNNVPYIVPLDEGSSAQAPNGMSAAAVQAARKELSIGSVFKEL
jgi:hypothetical protein